MTTLALTDSSLFTAIDDCDAQLVQGGDGIKFNVSVDPCGVKVCYSICVPGLYASGKLFIANPNKGSQP